MNNEQWTMNNEQWTMNNEQWTMNNEQWTKKYCKIKIARYNNLGLKIIRFMSANHMPSCTYSNICRVMILLYLSSRIINHVTDLFPELHILINTY